MEYCTVIYQRITNANSLRIWATCSIHIAPSAFIILFLSFSSLITTPSAIINARQFLMSCPIYLNSLIFLTLFFLLQYVQWVFPG